MIDSKTLKRIRSKALCRDISNCEETSIDMIIDIINYYTGGFSETKDDILKRLESRLFDKIQVFGFEPISGSFYLTDDDEFNLRFVSNKEKTGIDVALCFDNAWINREGDYLESQVYLFDKKNNKKYELRNIGAPFDSFDDSKYYGTTYRNPDESDSKLPDIDRVRSFLYDYKNILYSFNDQINDYLDWYVNKICNQLKEVIRKNSLKLWEF